MDLECLVTRNAARAHEHLEEDVAKGEGVGFGGEGGEGGVGYVVVFLRLGGAEVGDEGEIGCWMEAWGGD